MTQAKSPIVVNIPGARILSSRGSGANGRQHRYAKASDVEFHRTGANVKTSAAIALHAPGFNVELSWRRKPPTPIQVARCRGAFYPAHRVTLTRVHPAGRVIRDDDNLSTAFKPTRDGVADALGVDDSVFMNVTNGGDIPPGRIGLIYNQIVGPWGIRITIEAV